MEIGNIDPRINIDLKTLLLILWFPRRENPIQNTSRKLLTAYTAGKHPCPSKFIPAPSSMLASHSANTRQHWRANRNLVTWLPLSNLGGKRGVRVVLVLHTLSHYHFMTVSFGFGPSLMNLHLHLASPPTNPPEPAIGDKTPCLTGFQYLFDGPWRVK